MYHIHIHTKQFCSIYTTYFVTHHQCIYRVSTAAINSVLSNIPALSGIPRLILICECPVVSRVILSVLGLCSHLILNVVSVRIFSDRCLQRRNRQPWTKGESAWRILQYILYVNMSMSSLILVFNFLKARKESSPWL